MFQSGQCILQFFTGGIHDGFPLVASVGVLGLPDLFPPLCWDLEDAGFCILADKVVGCLLASEEFIMLKGYWQTFVCFIVCGTCQLPTDILVKSPDKITFPEKMICVLF